MAYPYQKAFQRYCKQERHYADSTMQIVNLSINVFWRYFQGGSDEEPSIKEIQAANIQEFLDSLETNLDLKKNTINKYLSHIRLYFTFLYSHGLIDHYPMLEINGRKFNRQRRYVINWMPYIPKIAAIKNIHPETIMMLVAIAQGFTPNQALKLRYSSVIGGVTDPKLKYYIKSHLNFEQDDDPYILGKKFGGFYSSDFHLIQKVKPDRKLLGMELTLQSLRLDYVYSLLSQGKMTDDELMQKLHINAKTLVYYRQNMMQFTDLVEFKMPK